ncbi:MAG: single-stranded-DNA-specific exonuclease RecJ [Spirochaetales bacterium]|nr:single-stranded-DNA-specific exonuclease RecJ [Spirochaetales bacterium]
MIWIKKEIDGSQVKELSIKYEIDIILASILVRRGIVDPEKLVYYLEDDIRFLNNPFCFLQMEKAVDRIYQAIEKKEKILIYGDRDVDGITSTVCMVESLTSLGADVGWAVPLGNDDYGLSLTDVEDAAKNNMRLLITVDCGISNINEVELAITRGIDVIVVDHHNPPSLLPHAFAVINPKTESSGYPFRELAGCGVASKLDWALNFAKSDFYKKDSLLLSCTPLNESYLLEAVVVRNCVEKKRFRENVVPGIGAAILGKLTEFAGNTDIYLFDKAEQLKLFGKAFTVSWPFKEALNFQDLLKEVFPALAGKSLLRIKEKSRIGKYQRKMISEFEMFISLYMSAVLKKEKPCIDAALQRLDLVALGTIADLMPLVNENRIIVKKGLSLISSFSREGLRELLVKKNLLGKEISTTEISWQISPIINASGRLGEPNKAVELFLAKEQRHLDELSEYIFDLNEQRKDIGDTLWRNIQREARESYDKTNQKFVIVADRSIHRGVTGILATKLVNYFKVPACIICQLPEKAVGSMRSTPDFPLTRFLDQFKPILTDYGGHDMAAGFNLPNNRLDEFLHQLHDVIETTVFPEEQEKFLLVDAEIPLRFLSPDLYNNVVKLMPFGEGNPPVLFFTPGLLVEKCDVVGKKEQVHIKLLLSSDRFKFPAMLWNGVELYKTQFSVGEKVDVVYKMSKNTFMNTETIQLVIEDIARHGEKKLSVDRQETTIFDENVFSKY